jgi:hypothetical protein
VIAVAHQTGTQLVLIDDRRARSVAEQAYGLRVKGSAGILVAAKRAGLYLSGPPLTGADEFPRALSLPTAHRKSGGGSRRIETRSRKAPAAGGALPRRRYRPGSRT